MDEDTLRRWMALEVKDLRDRLARRRRPLTDLLDEDEPSVETQGGDAHDIDREELERWDEVLRPHERHRLRLPVTFVRSKDTPDSLFLEDELAADALRRMGLVGEEREIREGKLWLGKPLADEVIRALPTTIQLSLR